MEQFNAWKKILSKLIDKVGGCLCGDVRFKLTAEPMYVQACHCLDCQRISGSAFIINMWIEAKHVELTTASQSCCNLCLSFLFLSFYYKLYLNE